jgi:hypothetical protein
MATSLPVWPEVVDAMTLDQYESRVAQERRELAWSRRCRFPTSRSGF